MEAKIEKLQVCPNETNPVLNLNFYIIDMVDNVEGCSTEKLDELLLEKEKRWIRNLLTCHKGMNSAHDLNRTKRMDREKIE